MSNELHQKEKKEWLSITSLCLGIASVFLWEFSIIPILAIIFGGIGLFRDAKKWKAGIGLTLGIIFLVVRIAHGQMDGIFSSTYSSNDASQTSSVPISQTPPPTPAPIPRILPSEPKQTPTPKVPTVPTTQSSVSPTQPPSLSSDTNIHAKGLELTKALIDKYTFLGSVLNLSIPMFENVYQKQQNGIASLQKLQNLSYRSDVAQVLEASKDEAARLLGVLNNMKDEQVSIEQKSKMLQIIVSLPSLMPTDSGYIKNLNDETASADTWIYTFHPKNPDNISAVMIARDQKNTELQLALLAHIKNTQ